MEEKIKSRFWSLSLVIGIITAVLVSGIGFMLWPASSLHAISMNNMTNISEQAKAMSSHRDYIVSTLMDQGDYACCLEKPCSYCITKTPGHGEGETCSCLDDVINGRHPCGECMGEILEGHGNKYLAKYFARSLSDELGEYSLDTLRQIITDKYGILISEQY